MSGVSTKLLAISGCVRRRTRSKAVSSVVRFRSFTSGLVPSPDPRLMAMNISVFTVEVVDRAGSVVDERQPMQAGQLG